MSDICESVMDKLSRRELPKESEVRQICEMAAIHLMEEPNVLNIPSPITICGDIHGQYYDLLKLFEIAGPCPQSSYLFLGDYVDRGRHSLETFLLLLCYKIRYPDKMFLLRGNHEERELTKVYGFYDECLRKYGSGNVWRDCTWVFDYLPIAAIVDNTTFCVHGGLSPFLKRVSELSAIERIKELPKQGILCDMLWSDPAEGPNEVDGYQVGPRGAGYLFGHTAVDDFLDLNDFRKIVRAHQLTHEGVSYNFQKKVVTIWSAPNYCFRAGNKGAVLQVVGDSCTAIQFTESEESVAHAIGLKAIPNYFL